MHQTKTAYNARHVLMMITRMSMFTKSLSRSFTHRMSKRPFVRLLNKPQHSDISLRGYLLAKSAFAFPMRLSTII